MIAIPEGTIRMPVLTITPDLALKARLAGMLYLVIIIAGLGAELGLRGPQ